MRGWSGHPAAARGPNPSRTATRFNIKAQGREAHLGSVATMQQYPERGFTSEPGVLWNPVRGTRRFADREPSVRCATLGFEVQLLRRWFSRRKSKRAATILDHPLPTPRLTFIDRRTSRGGHRPPPQTLIFHTSNWWAMPTLLEQRHHETTSSRRRTVR